MAPETENISGFKEPWEVIPRNYASSPDEATEAAQQALKKIQEEPGLTDVLSFLSILLSPHNPLISKGKSEVIIREWNRSLYRIKATTLYTYFVPKTLTMGIIEPYFQVHCIDLHNIKDIWFIES